MFASNHTEQFWPSRSCSYETSITTSKSLNFAPESIFWTKYTISCAFAAIRSFVCLISPCTTHIERNNFVLLTLILERTDRYGYTVWNFHFYFLIQNKDNEWVSFVCCIYKLYFFRKKFSNNTIILKGKNIIITVFVRGCFFTT